MAIAHYLAMTASEMAAASSLPPQTAWMACHFSPYSTGLINLPQQLPEESLLILNDRIPIHGHDPERVLEELNGVIDRFHCSALLLDLQNSDCPESGKLADFLVETIQIPVGITPEYRRENAAVFLPDVPSDIDLDTYLAPWNGERVWLETALEGLDICLNRDGAAVSPNRRSDEPPIHADEALHCHYSIKLQEEEVRFRLWRTREDLSDLLTQAEQWGVEMAIGLYQELGGARGTASDIS